MIRPLARKQRSGSAAERSDDAAFSFGLGVGLVAASLLVHSLDWFWSGLSVGVVFVLRAVLVIRREARQPSAGARTR
jgi:hypothetical protein